MFHRKLRIIIPILVIVLVPFAAWFGAQTTNRQPAATHAIQVDGTTYPLTAAGVQAAINAVETAGGIGGSVKLPAGKIDLGSTALTMRKNVCLIGESSRSTWLTYNGTGAAITFPAGMQNSCLKQITVFLGASAGENATGITIQGDFNAGVPTIYNLIQDVAVSTGAVHAGQIGIHLSGGGVPSSIQLSWFDTISVVNFGQPIVTNGEEGNFWNGIHVVGFSSVAVNDMMSNDIFWQIRITGGKVVTASAIGFQEAGVLNQIQLMCDFGVQPSQSCINDTGGKNIWNISALSPHGRIAASSFANIVGAAGGNIPAKFQVPVRPQ
jgi:hypothetical protein